MNYLWKRATQLLITKVLGLAAGANIILKYGVKGSEIWLAGDGVGYETGKGVGSTVTQATNRSTGVTINALSGEITMNAASLAAGAEATFTVTNSKVAAGDVPVVALQGITTGTPVVNVTAVAAGSFDITITNLHAATADTTADVINFAIIKGAST